MSDVISSLSPVYIQRCFNAQWDDDRYRSIPPCDTIKQWDVAWRRRGCGGWTGAYLYASEKYLVTCDSVADELDGYILRLLASFGEERIEGRVIDPKRTRAYCKHDPMLARYSIGVKVWWL